MLIVIPWQAGCTHRERALGWVLERYAEANLPVAVAEHDGPWCKAQAVAAIDLPAGPIAIADADVWLDADALRQAFIQLDTHGWAIPHGDVCRLTEAATDALIAGDALPANPYTERPYHGWAGGGIVVTTGETYRQAPLDPRFVGWGQEDESWALALRALAGEPWRGTAPLTHLYHPPQDRLNRRTGTHQGRTLHRRYLRARRNADAMRALLEEVA